MGRKTKIIKNVVASFGLEIINILSGFIIPRLIILFYGSPANGLVNSIANFIGYVSLLQSGVGSVIKAALYKPLAENNRQQINNIIATLEHFFRKITVISVAYVAFLAVFFPLRMSGQFDAVFTASLVVIISFSTLAQYLWGMPYQLLLEADQKGYVYSCAQGAAVLLNTILSVVLIHQGCSLQLVKAVTALVFVARPIVIRWYAVRKYQIDRSGKVDLQLLKSRWDGFAQAIAFFVHSKTDVFVLTIFATLSDVSVYTVYAMILSAMATVVQAVDQAVGPAFGNMIAKKESVLNERFEVYRHLIHILATVIFGTGCITASRFVQVYTSSVTDYTYVKPLFGLIILSAEYIYCLRLPYNSVIYAAGKIKETRNPAIVEAMINVVLSIIMVHLWHMEGVAIATLTAMVYRTVSLAAYLRGDVLYLSAKKEIRRFAVSMIAYLPCVPVMYFVESRNLPIHSYISWALFAAVAALGYAAYVVVVNLIFYRSDMKRVALLLRSIRGGRSGKEGQGG